MNKEPSAISVQPLAEQLTKAAESIMNEFDFTVPGYAELYKKAASRITELETFVEKFRDNFNTCQDCDGTGYDNALDDICRRCNGEGQIIASVGILYNELRRESIDLLGKDGE